jgi:hypothetical protein
MLKRSKYDMPAVQNFADPSARQMELDAFEQQRQAYNDEMARYMAKGGEVTDDLPDRTARSIVKDFEGYGYTKDEIMGLADQVAAAGRGGDELLAYLSPESVRFLKENGGSGTINPVTGLSEFKGGGGFIGEVIQKIGNAFSPSSSGTSSLDQGEEFAKAQVATIAPLNGPISPEQAAARAELEARQRGAKAQPAFVPPTVGADSPYYESPEYTAYVKANSGGMGGMIGTADMYDSPYFGTVGSGSLGKQNDKAYESYLGRLAQESKQREQDAADAAARAQAERDAAAERDRMIAVPVIGAPAPPTARDQLEQMPAPPMAPPPYTESPPAAPPQLTPIAPPPLPTPPPPRDRIGIPGLIGGAAGNIQVQNPNVAFNPVSAAAALAQLDLSGRVMSPLARNPGTDSASGAAPQGQGASVDNIPDYSVDAPNYASRGVGAIGDIGSIPIYTPPTGPMFGNPNRRTGGAATNPSSYFALTPQTSTGLAPGSAAIGSPDMPLYGARNTMNAIGSSPNLSPTMLGGAQNAGFFTDRMGNRITAPGMAPYRPFGFAKGGDVDLEALMAQNAETLSDEQPEETTNTNPVGTAQQMLSDLSGAGKASPTRQAIKRTKTSSGGGADADKAMQLAYEDLAKGDLGAMKDRAPAARNTESARSQMEELARIYQMKIRSAQESARGLSANTFGAPTLEGSTLTKSKLTKKRFKDGGEAKKSDAEDAKEPGIFSVNSYATDASARMFPDQLGQDDQRDAARHMLAAAALSKKFGPGTAEFLGKVHERTSNPESFFSMFGIGKPRDDYELDVHNNKLGADLASRTTSQADLEKLVQALAKQAQTKRVEGKPYIMGREQMDARRAKAEKGMTPPPEYRAEGSPEEGEESLDKYYAPKARPSTGLNRKKGPVSKALDSGEAYVNMAKGATELPYDILGAPVDVATMLMRPFGYTAEKPIMGSDFIKEKMTQLGIRQAPPADPTAKGFYTAGELLSNLTNPAGVTRAAVKGAEKTGKAATAVAKDFQQYNQQLSAPGASYAVPPQSRAVTPAPASNLGFYSAAEQAALNLPRKEGPGNAFLNDLMKASDVKKEELSAMGLDEFLKGKPKVTRQEVQDFIANNRIDVKEVQLGGNVVEDPAGIAKRKAVFDKYEPEIQALYRQIDFDTYDPALSNRLTELQNVRDREADAAYVVPESAPTRFDNPRLVLPGGKNYREILLTTPVRNREAELDAAQITAGDLRRQTADLMEQWKAASELNPGTPGTAALYQKVAESRKLRDQAEATALDLRKEIRSQTYRSSHFNQPNVLAHMRVNDRVDADGKKMLFIEEIQSDWHQAGREKGYNTSERQLAEQKKLDNLLAERRQLGERQKQLEELALPYTSQGKDAPRDILDEWNNVSNRLQRLQTEQNRLGRGSSEGVPDAPFKDTWHQLALKRALKYAADNGYERVGLTTGMQQSQRYNLSKQVDHISYEPTEKGFYINVISKDGPNVLNGDYSAKELEGIVGREVTKKMLAKEGKNEFNPEIEPDLAEIRRLDGVDLQLEDKGMKKYYDEIYPAFLVKQGKKYGAQVGETRIKTGRGVPGGEPVRYIDITPEMKGAVPYAKGGEVDKNTAFIKAHS